MTRTLVRASNLLTLPPSPLRPSSPRRSRPAVDLGAHQGPTEPRAQVAQRAGRAGARCQILSERSPNAVPSTVPSAVPMRPGSGLRTRFGGPWRPTGERRGERRRGQARGRLPVGADAQGRVDLQPEVECCSRLVERRRHGHSGQRTPRAPCAQDGAHNARALAPGVSPAAAKAIPEHDAHRRDRGQGARSGASTARGRGHRGRSHHDIPRATPARIWDRAGARLGTGRLGGALLASDCA